MNEYMNTYTYIYIYLLFHFFRRFCGFITFCQATTNQGVRTLRKKGQVPQMLENLRGMQRPCTQSLHRLLLGLQGLGFRYLCFLESVRIPTAGLPRFSPSNYCNWTDQTSCQQHSFGVWKILSDCVNRCAAAPILWRGSLSVQTDKCPNLCPNPSSSAA